MTVINYNPSPRLLAKLKHIKTLYKGRREDNITQIAKIVGMHRSMVHALLVWDKKMNGKKGKKQ